MHCASAGRRRRATLSYDVIHETGSTQRITTLPEEDRTTATGNMHKKFGEDGTCSSDDMITDRQTGTHRDRHTHTHRHAHHNVPFPYRGGVKMHSTFGEVWTCGSCERITKWTDRQAEIHAIITTYRPP